MSALLNVKDLKVSYGGINAVKGIDLHVNQGELVALIGANGAGKSSSMKAIAGLLTPSAGEIHFINQETRKLPAYELVHLGLGMVPEGRGVFKRMTILENLQMGAYLKTNPKDIERKLEEVYSYFPRLKERLSQLAGTLSGGEQQRMAVARALINKPALVFADEPSGNLDTENATALHQLFFELRSEFKQSFVIVTHNEGFAQMADRCLRMKDGQFI